ncbi:hypothetical protein JVT61DRAFT_3921 [Boletus reticuloceps]|uniref:Uncharacterized protein n=1 Tax=Boletus reticuloceps TaxID=495285 RepID=A0A8I3A921_9AGAM|nr:hypothetical protein JVT61DRAFT_3921 [Boletus reticuloceps]
MPRGRPRKRPVAQNTAGLRNQSHSGLKRPAPHSSSESESGNSEPCNSPQKKSRVPSPESGVTSSDGEWELTTAVFDSLKFIADREESAQDSESEDDDDLLVLDDCTHSRLVDLAIRLGDDPSDESWLPPSQAKQALHRKPRPVEYMKGPDVGNKSARTQRRYKKLL